MREETVCENSAGSRVRVLRRSCKQFTIKARFNFDFCERHTLSHHLNDLDAVTVHHAIWVDGIPLNRDLAFVIVRSSVSLIFRTEKVSRRDS